MAKKQKYYVIWEGKVPGIYTSWEECQVQIAGFLSPKFKSFDSRVEAEFAFARNYTQFIKKSSPEDKPKAKPSASSILSDSIGVDAACSGNPGDMEYQCVETNTKKLIFHQGPFKDGTNNVGEFVALVHALALLHKNNNTHTAIYTDSKTAMSWPFADLSALLFPFRQSSPGLRPAHRAQGKSGMSKGAGRVRVKPRCVHNTKVQS